MLNLELFTAFVLITIVLIVTPGPIVTLVIATGASQGPAAALKTVFGTAVGNAVLMAGIAFGLNWVLRSSTLLFDALRYAGAAYLIWLGVRVWRGAGGQQNVPAPQARVHFWRGFLVALSNPKTLAFFTAFLPQFVDPMLPAVPQLAAMCAVSVLIAAAIDSGWAIAAGLGRAWFVKPARAKLLAQMSGAVLVGGGVWLSLSRRPA